MTNHIWLVVLSSSLASSVLAALISGIFVLQNKRNEYTNDYFKAIIARRLDAYDKIELLINQLKTTVLDEDQCPYHQAFSEKEHWAEVYMVFLKATANPLWLSNDLFSKAIELNVMIFQASTNQRDLVEFGKANYRAIAQLREELEILHAKDMLSLHKVKKFFKSKGRRVGFGEIDARDGFS